MLNKLLGIILFGVIIGIVAFNYPAIVLFSQDRELEATAKRAMQAQNWQKVIDLYRNGHKKHPDNMNILGVLSWAEFQNQELDKAEVNYREILKQQPSNLNARMGLARVLQAFPIRQNEAVDQYRLALKDNPASPVLMSELGRFYREAAENPLENREPTKNWLYSQAAYYLEQAAKLDPSKFQTFFNLGLAYQNMQDLQPAAKAYCNAIRLQPDNYQARYNLGMVLTSLNMLDEGYRQLNRSVEIVTNNNDMTTAMKLAQLVQTVKNGIYNDPKKGGLKPAAAEDLMGKGCAVTASAESDSDGGK